MALLALLGGVDPDAMFGAFLVTIGMAVLGCCLALVFSLWAGKTHEALLGTYAVWGLWMLAKPMIHAVNRTFNLSLWVPFETAPPFYLLIAPYWWPGTVGMSNYVLFFSITTALSLVMAVIATWRLRAVCTRRTCASVDRLPTASAGSARLDGLTAGSRHLPGPSLDWNPVLWRRVAPQSAVARGADRGWVISRVRRRV